MVKEIITIYNFGSEKINTEKLINDYNVERVVDSQNKVALITKDAFKIRELIHKHKDFDRYGILNPTYVKMMNTILHLHQKGYIVSDISFTNNFKDYCFESKGDEAFNSVIELLKLSYDNIIEDNKENKLKENILYCYEHEDISIDKVVLVNKDRELILYGNAVIQTRYLHDDDIVKLSNDIININAKLYA